MRSSHSGGIVHLRIDPIDAGIWGSESRRPVFMRPAESSPSHTRMNSGEISFVDLAAGAFLIGRAALKRVCCGGVNPGTVRGQRYVVARRISELPGRTGLVVTRESAAEGAPAPSSLGAPRP